MSRELSIAVAVDGSASHDSLLRMLPRGGPLKLAKLLRIDPEALAGTDQIQLDAIVVICGTPSPEVVAFVRAAVRTRPWLPVVVACSPGDSGALHELIAAGADDIVPVLDAEADELAGSTRLLFALEKARAVRSGAGEQPARPGEVVTVIGPKGGTGKTLTTCNSAVAVAAGGSRVVVVDIDLQFGDVGLSLGLRPDRTIYDLAAAGGSLDADMIGEYLTPHSSGVRVLTAPVRPDQAGSVTPALVRDVLSVLRRMCDVVIVDTPPGFTPEVIAAVDSSTRLWVVAGMDALSLKNTRLALDTLERMGCPEESMQLVLNRADSQVGITPGDVHALLGRRPEIRVPSNRDIVRAVNEGRPIVLGDPNCEASRAFVALAGTLSPEDERPVVKPRRMRLRRRSETAVTAA